MVSRSVAVDWYQSDSIVTATVLIKPLSPNETVTARFESQRCAVHIGGEQFTTWITIHVYVYVTHLMNGGLYQY